MRVYNFTSFVRVLLQNRRLYVEEARKIARKIDGGGTKERSCPIQGSALSLTLVNIYSTDQPHPPPYADYVALISQAKDFETVETHLTNGLHIFKAYYCNNHLQSHPAKTQVCAIIYAAKMLIEFGKSNGRTWGWCHCRNPKFLKITLDCAHITKHHCLNTKQKVSACNYIFGKLTQVAHGVLNLLRIGLSCLVQICSCYGWGCCSERDM